jgi:hypothetical protein
MATWEQCSHRFQVQSVHQKAEILYHDVQIRSVVTDIQVILMSVINGTTIANIYYTQPILAQIASSLHVRSA